MPDDTLIDLRQTVAELRQELDARTTERDEALAREAATAEVLQVINSSPGDLVPVFDAILEKALQLCEAAFGILLVRDGGHFRTAALHGVPPALAEFLSGTPREPGKHTAVGRMLGGEDVVHFEDMTNEPAYRSGDPRQRAFVELGGTRTYVAVALRRDGRLVGSIGAYRKEVRPFSDKQIALLQNFAAQAVIAMENARLLTETREALEQQTATSEILSVISRSPTDIRPVFEAIVARAASLCEAEFSAVARFEDGLLHLAALHSMSPEETAAFYTLFPRPPARKFAMGRAFIDARPAHLEDVLTDLDYDPLTLEVLQSVAGYRSFLAVPIFREGRPIGVVGCGRRAVKPFTAIQIALLETFADQAAIAIENVRLFNEIETRNRDLGEALEQQTATAEVLQVINSSPGDLSPVFDAMLEKALRLCGGSFGELRTYDGERFSLAATHGVPTAYVQHYARGDRGIYGPGTGPTRILAGERVVHISDLVATEPYQRGDPDRVALVELGGARAYLLVPLLKDAAILGYIMIYRKEVGTFSDKQIALLQSFAAQAVIAMENARLITETREALQQQTATAEVLQVINSSPGDLAPVFDAMLEKATRLCNAAFGILWTYHAEGFYAAALHGVPAEFADHARGPQLPHPEIGLGRVLAGEDVVVNIDVADEDVYRAGDPLRRALVEVAGARSKIDVALRKDGALLGDITIFRREVLPFSEKEIALLQNFAAQAVIAMENARLITETREALEQQTATAEILGVINSSPGDLAPVFDAILDKAHTLCGATRGTLFLFDGLTFRGAAIHGYPEELTERLRRGVSVSQASAFAPLLAGARLVHFPDLTQVDDPMARTVSELGGVRTNLLLPLRKEGALLGLISCNRQEVRPYRDKEIALLESFAAQAVIAMDNARLLNEIRQRQAELRVTFDNMGDGVAMFDGNQRLAAWNLNFQRILDLPDALLAERPSYPDYIRFLAERGEFGSGDIEAELSRRLEAVDQELRLEHTRPDGHIIEVRRNAVPGGGFVVIYSDITERKRAEEEIRGARDTAQRALQELKTTQASLLHAQKMAALGQLTAGIAHEIKNPLNFVNNFAGLSVELLDELKTAAAPGIAILDDDTRAEIDETVGMLTGNLEKITEHGKRADGIVTSMLAHSRGSSGERQSVDVNAMVEESLNLAYHGARAQDQKFNITLERDLDRNIAPCELVPQDVTRVLLNLFGNGFYAATKRNREAGGGFRPVLRVTTRDLGRRIEIRVRDNGTGIPPESRDKLFQPFFTTKPTGEGTGLGLSISYDIVTQQHGGTIEVDSMFGEFTEFTIRLPRSRPVATTGMT